MSAVIDWADANTLAETTKVGAVGISYGAGVSLLASANDRRIRAVGALSGWADLIGSLNPTARSRRSSSSRRSVRRPSQVDRINARGPAVFLANAFQGSIFPPVRYADSSTA